MRAIMNRFPGARTVFTVGLVLCLGLVPAAGEQTLAPSRPNIVLMFPDTFAYPLDGSVGRNTVMMGRGAQVESSRAQWVGQTLVIKTTLEITERGVAKPFAAELTRTLRLESPTMLVVEVTRAGVLGGPPSTTRSVYRKG